jgi:hypothetical protein
MIPFKQYFLTEVKDTKRNREEVIRAYGLTDHAPDHVAQTRAKELIDKWTKLEPLIDPEGDYFDAPSGRQYNPKDIFSWSRLSKDEGYDRLEALQNLEAMMINLSRQKDKKAQAKLSEKDYDMLHDSELATLYRPKSEAASCKLGANTKWCTAATQGSNQFDSYMAQGVVLFYAIVKATQEKFAVAMYPGGEVFEVYDSEDDKMDWHDWEYKASELGLPTDKAFYRKHGPAPIDILKKRVNEAKAIMSGSQQRDPYEPEVNHELLMDVLNAVDQLHRSKDQDQLNALAKYREDEGMPDEVFLMDVFDISSLKYFTDYVTNPEGSNNWTNGQFQEEISRRIRRLTTMTKQANGADGTEDDVHDVDDMTREVYGPSDGDESRNIFWGIRMYISRHMKDKWPELEAALIDLWITNHESDNLIDMGGYSDKTEDPMKNSMMWLRLVMDYRNGNWPDLEQALHNRIKSVLHKDSSNENLINGLVAMGLSFNRQANHFSGKEKEDRLAHVPESEEQLKQYADGRWDIEGPPLTQSAETERRWKAGKQTNPGLGERTQHYLNDL